MENVTDTGEAGIDVSAPVVSRHSVTVTASADTVEVSNEESFAGPPVDADPAPFQEGLDTTLTRWLDRLRSTAEAAAR